MNIEIKMLKILQEQLGDGWEIVGRTIQYKGLFRIAIAPFSGGLQCAWATWEENSIFNYFEYFDPANPSFDPQKLIDQILEGVKKTDPKVERKALATLAGIIEDQKN